MGKRNFAQTVLVSWPRWPPCPYMVKTFKTLLLRNQKADDLETWYASSSAQVLPLPRGYIHVLSHEKNCIKSVFKDICLKLATNQWSDKIFLLTLKRCPLGLSVPAPGPYTYIKSWKKCIKSDFKEFFWKLATNDRSDKLFCWHQNFVHKGLSIPAPGLYTYIKSWKKKKKWIKSEFKEIFIKLVANDVTRGFCWYQSFSPGVVSPDGPGHMTKMAAEILSPVGCLPLPRGYIHVLKKIYIKSVFKDFYLKLATTQWSDKTFLLTSNVVPWGLSVPAPGPYTYIKSWKKCIKSDFKEFFWKLATNDRSDKLFCWHQNFVPKGLSIPAPWLYTCIKSWKKNQTSKRFFYNL